MKINIQILLLMFCAIFCSASSAPDVILKSRSASALNKVTLYPDSSFFSNAIRAFDEGELFEVIGESYFNHEDDDQNQKFKWYQVRTINNQEGWIFGDGLAVVVPTNEVDLLHKKIHKQKITLDNGFENSLMWIASVDGRDNFHKKEYMNPIYNEQYLIITNEMGKSVHINIGGENARGKNVTKEIKFQDLTGDAVPEVIVQQSSTPLASTLENKNLHIYSMQSGTLRKVFEEHISLHYKDDVLSPAIAKHIEIEKNIIRVEYIDFVNCNSYKQKLAFDKQGEAMERCMEFVTYSYIWNDKEKIFETLFEESRTAPKAIPKMSGLSLRSRPSFGAPTVTTVSRNEPLKVIKHFEKSVLSMGQKKVDNYLLVQHPRGEQGYISAKDINFIHTHHDEVLTMYFQQSPVSKNDFKSNKDFIVIIN